MKPIKNKVYCRDCGKTKMLFESERKAENFIKFNKNEIEKESGYGPQRIYFCQFCAGWHLTSISEKIGLSRMEQWLEQNKRETEILKEMKLANHEKAILKSKKSPKKISQEEQNQIMIEIESQIAELSLSQKQDFISEKISFLKNEIELLIYNEETNNEDRISKLHITLNIIYLLRKRHQLKKPKPAVNERALKEIEEWREWAKKIGY